MLGLWAVLTLTGVLYSVWQGYGGRGFAATLTAFTTRADIGTDMATIPVNLRSILNMNIQPFVVDKVSPKWWQNQKSCVSGALMR